MSKIFDSIQKGLNETVAFAKCDATKAVVHGFDPVPAKEIFEVTRISVQVAEALRA